MNFNLLPRRHLFISFCVPESDRERHINKHKLSRTRDRPFGASRLEAVGYTGEFPHSHMRLRQLIISSRNLYGDDMI